VTSGGSHKTGLQKSLVVGKEVTMAKFKVGDLVVLKSGGPPMTVQQVNSTMTPAHEIQCQWFSGKKLEQGYFASDSLTKAPPETPKDKQ
jgi:uncharacterized protein YodC (DUF2158 family)